MRTGIHFQNLNTGHINDFSPGKKEILTLFGIKRGEYKEYSDYELSIVRDLTLTHQQAACLLDVTEDSVYKKRQALGFKYYKDTKTWSVK